MSNHIGARRCFFCGISTVRGPRRRFQRPIESYLLTKYYITAHPSVLNYAENCFGNREIMAQDRICRPCLQRADRYAIAQRIATDEAEVDPIEQVLEPSPIKSAEEQLSDPLSSPEEITQNSSDASQDDLEEEEIPKFQNVPVMALSDYKRASCNSNYCIIYNCNARTNLCRINLIVRLSILTNQHIYIPRGNRICREHLESRALEHDDFVSICRSVHNSFNSAQISDMLAMLNKKGLQ